MRLIRFLVTNFRSVNDSGWVDADSVTALIGENESGKTNLLLPLWKLNPAREGEILPTADYPKKMFGEIRETPGDYCFITAEFDTEGDAAGLAAAANISQDAASVVTVQRFYDGAYRVSFPRHRPVSEAEPRHIRDLLVSARSRIAALVALKQEAGWKVSLLSTIEGIEVDLDIDTHMTAAELDNLIDRLRSALPDAPAKRSVIVPCVEQAIDSIAQIRAAITAAPPGDDNNVVEAVLAVLPPFVYYSNYGNLDSEIYLPHVVQNLKRQEYLIETMM